MNLWPDFDIQPISECEPGQLVRVVNYWSSGAFAVVARDSNSANRALILLDQDRPRYVSDPEIGRLNILAFKNRIAVEIDQRGPFESRIRTLYEESGCIVIEPHRKNLNVASHETRLHYGPMQFDLTTYELHRNSSDLRHIAVFGKWVLYLERPSGLSSNWLEVVRYEFKETNEKTA